MMPAAYIRSLAQMRGRNIEWAEQAVRQAVSLTADEALKLKVIDVVARDVPDLLRQLDGRKVNVLGVERTLDMAGANIVTLEPDWRSRLLAVIADPSLAYLLMLAGIFGLFFEFSNPGFVLPGVVGAISLLLALFAFQMLPVNYAGLGLIILGLAFMIAEVFIPSFGVVGIGGVVAFMIGSVMLIDTDIPGYGVSWSMIVPVGIASALFIFFRGRHGAEGAATAGGERQRGIDRQQRRSAGRLRWQEWFGAGAWRNLAHQMQAAAGQGAKGQSHQHGRVDPGCGAGTRTQ